MLFFDCSETRQRLTYGFGAFRFRFLGDFAVTANMTPADILASAHRVLDIESKALKDLSDIANENIEARRAQIERAGDAVKSRAVALWDRLRNKA